jgi:hypothetical protein
VDYQGDLNATLLAEYGLALLRYGVTIAVDDRAKK